MNKYLSNLKVKYRKLIKRCPRQIKILSGPIIGGLVGLIGGIPGIFIGLLIGYLLSKLFVQSVQDSRILDYMENPGMQDFYEGESGLAAWCAISVLMASKNPSYPSAESIMKHVILDTSNTFASPRIDPSLIELFTRLAWSRIDYLNSDLLAESLAARRAPFGDSASLGRLLYGLAGGKEAKKFAREIYQILDPEGNHSSSSDDFATENTIAGIHSIGSDPWKILGIPMGTPHKEVKAHYRRLAKQFHPDELEVLDERHRQAASQAFIAIKEAYKEITRERQ